MTLDFCHDQQETEGERGGWGGERKKSPPPLFSFISCSSCHFCSQLTYILYVLFVLSSHKYVTERSTWSMRPLRWRAASTTSRAVVLVMFFSCPPPQWGGLDLDSRKSGCARLGGEVAPPLGVVVEEVVFFCCCIGMPNLRRPC